jgi:hypothetical protein
MRAILIDPTEKTVTEIDGDFANYKKINEAIGADLFTVVGLGKGETIYVDDEGLLTNPPKDLFRWKGYYAPLAGRGLILGTDDGGGTIATIIPLDVARANVDWLDDVELKGFDPIPDGARMNHPVLGNVPVVGSRAVFGRKGGTDHR